MGTIEERAKEYAQAIYGYAPAIEIAFIRGARSEHEALTRWRDPKEELPKDDSDVLVKTTLCAKYRIAFYKANGTRNYHWHENNGALDDDMVISWRKIHE